MTYIFGNIIRQESPESFVKKLESFGFAGNDRFVHLNRCESFKYGRKFFETRENYSMHNTYSQWNSPMGFYDMLQDWRYFKESVFHKYRMRNEDGKLVIEEFNTGAVVNDLIRYEKCDKYRYPPKDACPKSFTLGFYAYFFWRWYLKDAVRLVNFYGTSDESYNAAVSNKWHDLKFEEDYLKSLGDVKVFI